MNTKTILLLLMIFLIVVTIGFYPKIQELLLKNKQPPIHSELPFQNFSADSTQRVHIRTNTNQITLLKDSESWKVASRTASLEIIDTFFSALKESVVGNIVSRNIENSDEFGVASDSGIFVSFTNPSEERTIIIGKTGPENGTFYAKGKESNNVYLVRGPLKDAIKTKLDDWRNKTIVNISKDMLQSIEVISQQSFTLNRKEDGTWELLNAGNSKEISQNDLQSGILAFSPLEGREFLTDQESSEFAKQSLNKIIFKDKDQKILEELEYFEKEADYWMHKVDSIDVMKVSGYKLQRFFKIAQ